MELGESGRELAAHASTVPIEFERLVVFVEFAGFEGFGRGFEGHG